MALIDREAKIFIAGSKGMVGSAIKRKFKSLGYNNLLCPTSKELDLTNSKFVFDWFTKQKS